MKPFTSNLIPGLTYQRDRFKCKYSLKILILYRTKRVHFFEDSASRNNRIFAKRHFW